MHVKCWRGGLGCKSGCLNMIKGFSVYSHELYGIDNCENNELFNPYNKSYYAMQIFNRSTIKIIVTNGDKHLIYKQM